ncbi:MAG: hypothetical protein AUK47_10750 [Deltaproteobacteria bacterium CG2_30_63_29]|nr:MAG: hypothetical protein AUK47_10750 [Deltaproteobacteria bacterium CG2_30_63_29]PIW02467.1 MAG: hypothetical protein COW42_01535 [Deltaproteobacteria bacterium CG17_big_fil_post_rev_8_21_14_2_50_63_7]PJB48148.1 MAG: hypothetical protein CO108_02935 [Deltaproteobacteria bacterium CG_4_9_14_3_um_filter_63_12]
MPLDTPPKRLPITLPSIVMRFSLAFCVIAPASTLYILVCLLLLPFRTLRIRAGNLLGKLIGPSVFRLAGSHPVIKHRERVAESTPALFVCNHTSTVDMWVGMWLCPFGGCGTAKKEIVKIPFFGQAYYLSGHLLVDRGNRENAIRSMQSAGDVVRKHKLSLWMWPEGTRSRTGKLRPLKKGFVHLAIATGLPVVPVVFHDADLMWPGGSFRAVSGDLKIDVLEPIDTSNWKAETASEHAMEVWWAFQNSLSDRQKGEPPQ